MVESAGTADRSGGPIAHPVRVAEDYVRGDIQRQGLYARLTPQLDIFVRRAFRAGNVNASRQVWLLHGAGMDSLGFDLNIGHYSLLDRLAARGYDVFACDYRGHGRSSRVPDGTAVTAEAVRDDMVALIDLVDAWRREDDGTGTGSSAAQRVHLIGESFGTIVAPLVAKKLQSRCASMTLLGAIFASLGQMSESFPEFVAEAASSPGGYAYTTEEEWPELFISNAEPAVVRWHQVYYGTAYMYPVGPYLSVGSLPRDRELGSIRCPVRAVIGENDPFATRPDMENLMSCLGSTDTAITVQDGIGHLPYVEARSDEVLEMIEQAIRAGEGNA